MPFEDTVGHGGLLTTVPDLLRWNQSFAQPVVGDAAFMAALEQPGHLADGRATAYALGLELSSLDGVRAVSHAGSTAGYRSYLGRFPEQQLSVALLCNAGSINTEDAGPELARIFLRSSPSAAPAAASAPHRGTGATAAGVAGLYRNERTAESAELTTQDDGVRLDGRTLFGAINDTMFESKRGTRLEVTAAVDGTPSGFRLIRKDGDVIRFARVVPWKPDAKALASLEGAYLSEEADAGFSVCVRAGKLTLLQGPERHVALDPTYADAFTGTESGWLVAFERKAGVVTQMAIGMTRMRKLVFKRTSALACGPV